MAGRGHYRSNRDEPSDEESPWKKKESRPILERLA
jgi:hypothetical protein